MRLLLALLLLATTLCATRADDCITNVTVTCSGGWSFTVAGPGADCYNIIQSYTNITCRQILASSCDDGVALIFSCGTNCYSTSTVVATVSATCNTAVPCSAGQGGIYYCQPSANCSISIPAGVSSFIARIYPGRNVCCSITWCEPFGSDGRTTCIPPALGN